MIALSQCPGIDPIKDSTAALQAALNLKQPITWDCPVNCVMGSDPSKTIFVPDLSDVTFTPKGLLNVDSSGFPALAFFNVTAVWRETKIRYFGVPNILMPRTPNTWNDVCAKAYLVKQGISSLPWTGPTNTSALISIRGTANVQLLGGRIYVDDNVTADRFPTAAIELGPCALPHSNTLILPNFTTSNFELDGSVMGYVGSGAVINLTNITRKRYSDLQDVNGGNVGGANTWMAPPHWIYFNDSDAIPIGVVTIKDAVDLGDYRGATLRRTTASGYINSIKMPLSNGSLIDGYYSRCLDGGIGILAGQSKVGGKIRNMVCIYDSSLLSVNNMPCSTQGIFWPSPKSLYPASDVEVTIHDRAGHPTVTTAPNVPGMNVHVTTQY